MSIGYKQLATEGRTHLKDVYPWYMKCSKPHDERMLADMGFMIMCIDEAKTINYERALRGRDRAGHCQERKAPILR